MDSKGNITRKPFESFCILLRVPSQLQQICLQELMNIIVIIDLTITLLEMLHPVETHKALLVE